GPKQVVGASWIRIRAVPGGGSAAARLGFQTENDRRPGQSGTSQKLASAPSVFSLARHGAPPLDRGRCGLFRLNTDKRSKSMMDSIPTIARAPAAARAQ